jgi:hypothetical protein
MKTYTQLIEELYEAANTATAAKNAEEYAKFVTRNRKNPQLAARRAIKHYKKKLRKQGVSVDPNKVVMQGGKKHRVFSVQHDNPETEMDVNFAIGRGINREKRKHGAIRDKISKSVGPVGKFVGLDAIRKATGNIN